ncbi:MAG: formylglycine-generating enzyme family protein [Treponema sp.]|nr:formylglycine-generating enzyme family protein [Treponema sp.]
MRKKTTFQKCPAIIRCASVFLFSIFVIIVFLFSGCTLPPDEHEEETTPTETPPEHIPETKTLALSAIRGDRELSVGWTAIAGVEYEVWYGTENNIENAIKWNGTITLSSLTINSTCAVAGTVINNLDNAKTYYVWIKTGNKFSDVITEAPESSPEVILENFAYVTGGTVTGSHNYSMQITVPSDSIYMNAGKTLVKQGVFVEGRKITLDSFFMAKYETTRQLWHTIQVWAEANGYSFQNKINAPSESNKNLPISNINWRDAIVWCNAYSEMAELEPVYYHNETIIRDSRNVNSSACDNAVMNKNKNGYKLPTEIEREYAARGGDPGKADWMFLFSGSNNADDVAWHHGNSAYTIKYVGTKSANRLGIYDLSGNVQEWGWGWMNYNIVSDADTPIDGEIYSSRFNQMPMAGGGVGSNITMSCAADRWGYITNYKDAYVGFRVVRTCSEVFGTRLNK